MCFLYTREEVVCSQDTSPRDVFSLYLGRPFLISRKVDALPQGLRGRAPYIKNKNKAAWTVQAPYLKNKPHFTPKTPPKNDICVP